MSKASKRIRSAKRTLARSLSEGVQRRSWLIAGIGLLVAAALVTVGMLQYLLLGAPEPSSLEGERAIRSFLYVLVIPFAESAGVVLPTFVAALLALAVLEATQFGAAIVTQIVMFIGLLAALWGWIAGFAFVVGELSAADTLAAGVLALVCVLVAAVIIEVLPLGADLRLQEFEYRQQRVRAAFDSLLAGWEKRSGTLVDLGRKRPNSEALVVVGWYTATVVAAVVVAVVAAGVAELAGIEWWSLVLVSPLLPIVLLVGFHINALQLARLRPAGALFLDEGTVFLMRWVIFVSATVYLLLITGVAVLLVVLSAGLGPMLGGVHVVLPGLSAILVVLWLACYLPVFAGPRWAWLFGTAAILTHLRTQKGRLRAFKKLRRANDVIAEVPVSRAVATGVPTSAP